MNIALRTAFQERDRTLALMYGIKCARHDRAIWLLYYDYNIEQWCVEPYEQFSARKCVALCVEDVRYLLPDGETTKLS